MALLYTNVFTSEETFQEKTRSSRKSRLVPGVKQTERHRTPAPGVREPQYSTATSSFSH